MTLLQNRFLAAGLVAISGLLIAIMFGLVLGGGADPLQFSDPGPIVRYGTPIAKFVGYLCCRMGSYWLRTLSTELHLGIWSKLFVGAQL